MSTLKQQAIDARQNGLRQFEAPKFPCNVCRGILRYTTSNTQCVNCRKTFGKKNWMNPVSISVKEAIEKQQKTYVGVPCKKCGDRERFLCNRNCIKCSKERCKTDQHDPFIKRKRLLKGAETRAKKSGKQFNINNEDIIWNQYCPVFGFELDYSSDQSKGRIAYNAATLDRVDNTKGYIKGNVEVISWRANRLKSNATIMELQKIIKYMQIIRI